jgi:hypothetical protein
MRWGIIFSVTTAEGYGDDGVSVAFRGKETPSGLKFIQECRVGDEFRVNAITRYPSTTVFLKITDILGPAHERQFADHRVRE